MEIIEYKAKYKSDFIELNTAWIKKYFGKVEKEDYEEFDSIDEILQKGGMVFFAMEHDQVLATIMVHPLDDFTWELCKMAAKEQYKGRGAGNAVFETAIQYAKEHGAKRLFLLSNDSLKPAMHMYRKHHFQQIPLKDYTYERGNIAFEYWF